MQLPGNLRSTTLGDLLGALHRSGLSGVLELVEDQGVRAGRQHRVHLAQGLVERVETELPVARLGEILVHQGFLSRPSVDRIAADAQRLGAGLFGQLLLRERAITRDVLSAALRHQLRRRLETLFALKSAAVRFRVPRPSGHAATGIPLSPREFLHGRPRRDRRPEKPPERTAPRVAPAQARALDTLGLPAHATLDAVRQAFRMQALRIHPDRHPTASPPERQRLLRRFAELSAAYHSLVG
ncbi:MAG TPA: J domain-containing protein [Polyangiaceae bacterium]